MKTPEPRSFRRFACQLGYLGRSVCDDLTPWLAGVTGLGTVLLAWRDRRLLLLVLLWLGGTGILFVLLANYDLDRTSQWAMRVFFIPVTLGLAIPIAFALEWCLIRVRRMFAMKPPLAVGMTGFLVAVGPAVQVAAHWQQCDYSNYWYAYDHARNLLDCMLPQALLFPSGDHNTFPVVYLTMVEGQRSDVLIADIYGYTDPKQYESRPVDSPDSPEAWIIKHARRPVYYTVKKAPPVANAHFVVAGLLYHLLPDGVSFDGSGLFERCRYPSKLAFAMTGMETFRNMGVMEAQILYLLGVRPVWSPGRLVAALEVIPRANWAARASTWS